MKTRQYQEKHIEEISEKISFNRKIIGQMPTGGGKTVEFIKICERYILKNESSILILVNRKELMHQAQKTAERMLGFKPVIISSSTNRYKHSRIYIGMIESTVRRLNYFNEIGLVIVDECHVATFNKIHEIFYNQKIIGFTATPVSSSKKFPLNTYYEDIVVGPQIGELIKDGFLSQNITRCPKDIVDYTKFSINKMKGDFDEAKMSEEFSKSKFVTNVVNQYFRFCKGKKTIVFNVNIEHSKIVNECFNFCGYNSKHLDANSPDRDEIIKWFKETEDAILCNVGIATTGFDEPTILSVILNFATLSLSKFLQCCGRGGRIIDEEFISKFQKEYPYILKEKGSFDIIDLGGNAIRFGDWCDDRDWEYIFNNPPKAGEGVAPVKTCPSCEGIVPAGLKVCNLFLEDGEQCLNVFEKEEKQEKKLSDEMVIVTKNISVEKIESASRNKYDYYGFFKIIEDTVSIMKQHHEQFNIKIDENSKIKWFDTAYSMCIDWHKKTLSEKEQIETIEFSDWHLKRAKNHFDNLLK